MGSKRERRKLPRQKGNPSPMLDKLVRITSRHIMAMATPSWFIPKGQISIREARRRCGYKHRTPNVYGWPYPHQGARERARRRRQMGLEA